MQNDVQEFECSYHESPTPIQLITDPETAAFFKIENSGMNFKVESSFTHLEGKQVCFSYLIKALVEFIELAREFRKRYTAERRVLISLANALLLSKGESTGCAQSGCNDIVYENLRILFEQQGILHLLSQKAKRWSYGLYYIKEPLTFCYSRLDHERNT